MVTLRKQQNKKMEAVIETASIFCAVFSSYQILTRVSGATHMPSPS